MFTALQHTGIYPTIIIDADKNPIHSKNCQEDKTVTGTKGTQPRGISP